jgi:hypothetical protein
MSRYKLGHRSSESGLGRKQLLRQVGVEFPFYAVCAKFCATRQKWQVAKEQKQQRRSSGLDRDRRLERDLQVTALASGMEKSANGTPAKLHV